MSFRNLYRSKNIYLHWKKFHQYKEKYSDQSNIGHITDDDHQHQGQPIEIAETVVFGEVRKASKGNTSDSHTHCGDQHQNPSAHNVHEYGGCVDPNDLDNSYDNGGRVDIHNRTRGLENIGHIVDEAENAAELVAQTEHNRGRKSLKSGFSN